MFLIEGEITTQIINGFVCNRHLVRGRRI